MVSRLNTYIWVNSDDKWSDVKGSTLSVRYPVLLHFNKSFQSVEHILFVYFRNYHSLSRVVHSLEVLLRSEKLNRAVSSTISLKAFKYLLTVVQAHSSRGE